MKRTILHPRKQLHMVGRQSEIETNTASIGNATPLGLCAFAFTAFVLSMYNVGAGISPISPPDVIWGPALAFGGLIQLLAGMWEFRVGNTFGGLVFSSYGGFWLSLAALNIKSFGFLTAFGNDTRTLNHALGVFFLGWAIFTFLMLIASHTTYLILIILFFFLTVTFILLTASKFLNGHIKLQQAAGGFGILVAILAWYCAMASLLTPKTSYFTLPVFHIPKPDITRSQQQKMATISRKH